MEVKVTGVSRCYTESSCVVRSSATVSLSTAGLYFSM